MSTYKYLDDNGLVYYHSKVKALLNGKVDKVNGKGLSTNDYTTQEKNKLNGVEDNAQVNQNAFSEVEIGRRIIEANQESSPLYIEAGDNVALTVLDNEGLNYGFRISATEPDISGKEDKSNRVTSMSSSSTDIQYPSAKCVYEAIQNAIGSIAGINFEIVQTLPATGATGTIYLMSNGGAAQNIYDEYVYVNNAWEKIGSTDIDLSNYVQKTDMVSITNAEIDTIVS